MEKDIKTQKEKEYDYVLCKRKNVIIEESLIQY